MEEHYHIYWGLEYVTIEEDTEAKQEKEEVSDIGKDLNKPDNYLIMLMGNPPDLKGTKLLDHQSDRWQRLYKDNNQKLST